MQRSFRFGVLAKQICHILRPEARTKRAHWFAPMPAPLVLDTGFKHNALDHACRTVSAVTIEKVALPAAGCMVT